MNRFDGEVNCSTETFRNVADIANALGWLLYQIVLRTDLLFVSSIPDLLDLISVGDNFIYNPVKTY